ncbi:MAG: hypothetical protein P1R58_03880 [bacterium]|nr:hypothetical protein [bacterium]
MITCILIASALSAADFSVSSGYRHRTLYTEGEFTNWHQGEADYRISGSHELGDFRVSFGLSAFRPNGAGVHKADTSEALPEELGVKSGNLYGRLFYLDQWNQAGLSFNWRTWLGISATIREQEGGRNAWSVSGLIQPMPIIRLTLKRGIRHPLPEFSEGSYEYYGDDSVYNIESRVIGWRAPFYYNQFGFSFGDSSSILISSDYLEADIHPSEPMVGESSEKSLLGVVDGFWQDERIEGQGLVGRQGMIKLGLRRMLLDSRLRFYDGGRRFAHFGIASFSAEYWYAQGSLKRWTLLYAHGYGDGDLAGSAQLWPFLEGILRYLGERRHIIARVGGDMNFGRLDYQADQSGRFQWSASLGWLRVEPFFTMVSWRPLLFGFGIDDLRSLVLKLHRADLARLSLKPEMRFGRWDFRAEISQWVPVSIVKESAVAVDDGGGSGGGGGGGGGGGDEPEVPTAIVEESTTIWGGFSASLSVHFRF